MKTPPQLILVSTSPRRVSLLSEAGLKFKTLAPNAEEAHQPGESPSQMVKRLARQKAESVLEHRTIQSRKPKGSGCLLISADTIVVAPDKKSILSKPKSEKNAIQMLKQLAGQTHTVLTGYCLLYIEQGSDSSYHEVVRVVRSEVKMRDLSPLAIKRYVSTKEPLDKAGSYGAQGLGMALVESIRGSYANVVGLPICQVLQDIEALCGIPLFDWKAE